METVNHECYVSPEVAKLLKETGFDWEVSQWYEVLSDGQVMYSDGSTYNWNNHCYGESTFSMPTLDVAQRWLREVKNTHIEIIVGNHSGDWGYYLITDIHKPDDMPIINGIPKMSEVYDDFKSYEEAQEAGIKKALEIILKK